MKLVALELCGSIALLVFLMMLATIARHRVLGRSQERRSAALAEYLWAAIPWLMILSCAIPVVRQITASAFEPIERTHAISLKGDRSDR